MHKTSRNCEIWHFLLKWDYKNSMVHYQLINIQSSFWERSTIMFSDNEWPWSDGMLADLFIECMHLH